MADIRATQPPPNGQVSYVINPPTRGGSDMARVKFLKDTRHPDYGEVAKGAVLIVTRDYVRDYEALELAEESDDDVTEPDGKPKQK